MATITVKNIPDATYETLKKRASEHHRSINGEIIHLIEKATSCERINPEEHLARASVLRENVKGYVATANEIKEMIEEGRK